MAVIKLDERTGQPVVDLEQMARSVEELREPLDGVRRRLDEFLKLVAVDPEAMAVLNGRTDGRAAPLLLELLAEVAYIEEWTEQLEVANRYAGEGEEGQAA